MAALDRVLIPLLPSQPWHPSPHSTRDEDYYSPLTLYPYTPYPIYSRTTASYPSKRAALTTHHPTTTV